MKAVDTNVLARFFVDDADDPQATLQRPAAVVVMSERVFLPITVMLEFEWVLRGFYELPRRDVVRVLRALVGIEHVVIDARAAVLSAIDAHEAGLDLADALHLAQSAHCAAFATFDRALARRGAKLGAPVELLR